MKQTVDPRLLECLECGPPYGELVVHETTLGRVSLRVECPRCGRISHSLVRGVVEEAIEAFLEKTRKEAEREQ